MIQRYFLGANAEDGFRSLYGGFPPDPAAFLHIIKGGPGTGKSSFMRALGQAAEQRGQEVHYVICSGDPDSLDGVYLPALSQAWVDGTAPHVLEPGCFQVDSDYVNLGSFCRGPIRGADARRVKELLRDNKRQYREAQRFLRAAGALLPEETPPSPLALSQLTELLEQTLPQGREAAEPLPPRFLHAISCKGELWLTEELRALCPQLVRVSAAMLRAAQAYGGLPCPAPLRPERLEALLFPEAGLALVDRSWPVNVELDLSLSAPPSAEEQAQFQSARALMERAVTHLRRAKALHDELEAIYKGYMDFPALNDYTREELARLFP